MENIKCLSLSLVKALGAVSVGLLMIMTLPGWGPESTAKAVWCGFSTHGLSGESYTCLNPSPMNGGVGYCDDNGCLVGGDGQGTCEINDPTGRHQWGVSVEIEGDIPGEFYAWVACGGVTVTSCTAEIDATGFGFCDSGLSDPSSGALECRGNVVQGPVDSVKGHCYDPFMPDVKIPMRITVRAS